MFNARLAYFEKDMQPHDDESKVTINAQFKIDNRKSHCVSNPVHRNPIDCLLPLAYSDWLRYF